MSDRLPPPYSDTVATQEKGQFQPQQPQQQQQRQQQQLQHPNYFDNRCSFHVYKAAGMWSKDDIVTGDDKQSVLFYLEFPLSFFGGFDMTLHVGSKTGPPLLKINKSSFSSTLTISSLPNQLGIGVWRRQLCRTGIFTKSHEFVSLDGVTMFKWSADGFFRGNLICTRKQGSQKIVVATWRRTAFAATKDGHLVISPGYERDTILIVASALAMEEWSREEDDRRNV